MNDHKRFFRLVIIMICVSVIVAGMTMYILYRTAFKEEELRLRETAQSQARLIESIALYDKTYNRGYPGGPTESTLAQIKTAHQKYEGFGKTGEFILARVDGDMIYFLLRHRHAGIDHPNPVPYRSKFVEPIRRALSGESGVMIALDYRKQKVLAAYEPVAALNWGIISKIDLSQIRAPFLRAGIVAGCISLLIVSLGAALFRKVSEPIMRTLQQKASELEDLNAKMHREIEDRKKAEEQIHRLSHELMRAQETERQMISRELHDRVAQDLASFKYNFFSFIKNYKQAEPEMEKKIIELSRILDESIKTIRDLTYDLRPPVLEEIGLIQAVYEYCQDFSTNTDIDVDLQSGGIDNLDLGPDIQINLYRLIQEGLTNIRKHADAKSIVVRLSSAFPNIILRIEDDGRGFDVEKWVKTRSSEKRIGLTSMQERVRLLQGGIKIQSKPMQGTRISIKIPFQERKYDPKENDPSR